MSKDSFKKASYDAFFLKTGPFTVAVKVAVEHFFDSFFLLYPEYDIDFSPRFADFHIHLESSGWSRFVKPQAKFYLNNQLLFQPMPAKHAFPMFEWGVNWAIGNQCNFYLVIHAGVVEKNGKAILFPAAPGSGKSTLCAALSLSGWRLFSDELALIDLKTGLCVSIARPISLKNQSIDIVAKHFKHAIFSPTVHDTQKGSVSYLKVPHFVNDSPVKISAVIFPKYRNDLQAEYNLEAITKANALVKLADQSFNFHLLGDVGFQLLGDLVKNSICYDFDYSGNIDIALDLMDELVHTQG